MNKVNIIVNAFLNSTFWYHVWYKRTKKRKQELADIKQETMKIRKKAIGR